jgi:hypothetical protein
MVYNSWIVRESKSIRIKDNLDISSLTLSLSHESNNVYLFNI